MAAPTVYEDVAAGADVNGILFAGKKFWVAQRVPLRTTLLSNIRNNGGQIVPVEKQADYMIADHFRPKHCPPGSISYTFIEQSIKDGALADPSQHRAGPPLGETRDAGSRMRPAKSSRVSYTAEEDRILYKWVQDSLESGGGAKGTESGNQIYMELEKKYPRHTWQSYRDHYLKKLKHNPPPMPKNVPAPSPSEQPAQPTASEATTASAVNRSDGDSKMGAGASKSTAGKPAKKGSTTSANAKSNPLDELRALFDDEDYDKVYAATDVILERRKDGEKKYMKSWAEMASTTDQTVEQWVEFFEKIVLPQWQKDSTPKKDAVKARVFAETEIKKEEGETEEQEAADDETRHEEPSVAAPSTPTRNTAKTNGITNNQRINGSTLFNAYVEQFTKERSGRNAAEAYMFWARDEDGARKLAIWDDHEELTRTELHQKLRPIWEALSDAEKQKYHIMEDADKRRLDLEQVQWKQAEDLGGAKDSKQQQQQSPQQQTEAASELVETSSTVAQETPDYIRKAHANLMERIHDESDPFSKDDDTSRDAKRRKRNSSSPAARQTKAQTNVSGSQHKPLEISSTISSSSSEMDFEEPQDQDGNFEAMIQAQLERDGDGDEAMDDAEEPTPSIEIFEAQPEDADVEVKIEPEELDSHSKIPPDTPPRPQERKPPAFDTQAILESESQDLPVQPLPPPPQTQSETVSRDRSQSVASSASSEDLEISALPPPPVSPPPQEDDGRRSHAPPEPRHLPYPIRVPSDDQAPSQKERETSPQQQQPHQATQEPSQPPQTQSPTLVSLPHPAPTTPPSKTKPSNNTTTQRLSTSDTADKPKQPTADGEDDDEDPDPPLHPSEFPDFDAEQYAEGFTYAQIRAALKMTGCRPVLAVRVLDAWKAKESVPDERGIWTEQDDNDLYGGDGEKLERVVHKHGMDGWGGFEERMDFLERLRRKTGKR